MDEKFGIATNKLMLAEIKEKIGSSPNIVITNYKGLSSLELDKLRTYLRLSLELRYTSENQYAHAAGHVTEIGKLLGGWIKTA